VGLKAKLEVTLDSGHRASEASVLMTPTLRSEKMMPILMSDRRGVEGVRERVRTVQTKSGTDHAETRVRLRPVDAVTTDDPGSRGNSSTGKPGLSRLRKAAIAVGVLYLAGDLAGGLSAIIGSGLFKDPGYLTRIEAHQNQLAIGTLGILAMGFCLAAVPCVLYPIFRKTDEMVAIGYVIFRAALETVVYMAQANNWLLLGDLSRDYVEKGPSASPEFVTLGRQLKNQISITTHMTEIVFSLGALLFAYLFYQSQLIPRWMSIWGFVGALLYLAVPLLSLFTISAGWLQAPLALQEITLAVWLLVKGFEEHGRYESSYPRVIAEA
jgi:Domain of unknown function (DUF4386)